MQSPVRKRGRAPLPGTAVADARSVLQITDEALVAHARETIRLVVATRKDVHAALELLEAAA